MPALIAAEHFPVHAQIRIVPLPANAQPLVSGVDPGIAGFLLVALIAIGLTLLVSWDLEGGAAAVNQAGRCFSPVTRTSSGSLPTSSGPGRST